MRGSAPNYYAIMVSCAVFLPEEDAYLSHPVGESPWLFLFGKEYVKHGLITSPSGNVSPPP